MAEITLGRKHVSSKLEGGSAKVADGLTATGGTDYVKVFGYLIRTVEVRNGATNNATFTVEGGFKRDNGSIDWYTLATRTDGGDTFATTGITLAGDAEGIYEISPTPVTDYVRLNFSAANANGTDAWIHAEV